MERLKALGPGESARFLVGAEQEGCLDERAAKIGFVAAMKTMKGFGLLVEFRA